MTKGKTTVVKRVNNTTETTQATEGVAKTVILYHEGKKVQLNVNDRMPEDFLETKLKENQRYIPVHIYREIMRQLDEFGIPKMTVEKFIAGNNKSNVAQVCYRMTCELEWYRDGSEQPIILRGTGYSSISAGALLSDAVHGNMMTLEAKALRTALRYSYRIFEFPEEDQSDTNEQGTIIEKNKTGTVKTVDDVVEEVAKDEVKDEVKEASDKVTQEVINNIEAEIKKQYDIYFKNLGEQSIKDNEPITKKDILAIGTRLKEEFGEEYKQIIVQMILPDVNEAK